MDKPEFSDLVVSLDEIRGMDIDALFQKAVLFINTSGIEWKKTAYVMFKEIIYRDSNYSSGNGETPHFYLGNLEFFRKDDPESAIAHYTKELEMNPNDTWSYFYRGECWMDLKNYKKALSDYEQVARLDPSFPDIKEKIEAAKNHSEAT
ncbi:MAG: tetratricopeptide repeat protein [Desulfobacterales bacterium]|jgi:tetratricopeptide (TPR) repeat protein|nr:tetratricopeptide repeat protein [Desulfobacterales bacterium]